MQNRQIVLKVRPVGVPQPAHFEFVVTERPSSAPGLLLIENLYLSVDPAQRGYVNDEGNYLPPLPLGSVMRALAVGRVLESGHPDYRAGEVLYGWFGWQDYCVCTPGAVVRRVDPKQAPLSAAAGVLGLNGITALLALRDIGAPRAGETLLVTAAAGAVGSIVGQLGKQMGCRTIAVVGSDAKGERALSRYGYDTYLNYHRPFEAALRECCAGGVDIFFDNVAGQIGDTVIRNMKSFGRIVQCGTISIPVWNPVPQGPRIEREILTRRLRLQGFVIFDHVVRFDAAAAELAALLRSGQLKYDEDIEADFACAPQALADVYAGRNQGKKLVKLRD